jgi:hypothetical protein
VLSVTSSPFVSIMFELYKRSVDLSSLNVARDSLIYALLTGLAGLRHALLNERLLDSILREPALRDLLQSLKPLTHRKDDRHSHVNHHHEGAP